MANPLPNFENKVFDAFGSLALSFGLRHVRSVIHVPELAVFFEGGSVGLAVKFELSMTPWVELAHIERDDAGHIATRERCGLKYILAERAPLEQPMNVPLEDVDDPKLVTVLRELARQVQQYAADVLSGDFRIFPLCRRRAEENLLRTEEQLYKPLQKE
jgi:hypothetical protein